MSLPKILYPVQTLDNQLLLPAGTVLTPDTLDALVDSSKSASSFQRCPLLEFGSVKKDMLRFLDTPPWSSIFADKDEVARLLESMETVRLALPVLRGVVHFRDRGFYTYRHMLVVFALSTLLAMDLSEDSEVLMLEASTGPTHDFGKLCVPLNVLKKKDPLTQAERTLLEHHTLAGYVLLAHYDQDPASLAAVVARDHHERRDGSGYPRGMRLNERLVEIVVASDVYDALISKRPYRATSYDNRTALEEITAMAETNQISWDVVKALIARNRASKPHYSECVVSAEKRGTPPSDSAYGVIADHEEPIEES
ncbi:MAG: HD domain-containing phosphohydrolase [Thermodesulfobacteriota bacterium]|nr:HD domain-containing phosphohydrolase [Thermodesulfobacteriota bacterium]